MSNLADAAAVDPRQLHRAAPTLANLVAALHELEETGRFLYDAEGVITPSSTPRPETPWLPWRASRRYGPSWERC